MQKLYETVTQLLNKQPRLSFSHRKFPEESHRTTKHPSLRFALQSTFAGWTPSHEVKTGGWGGLQKRYAELTEKFGFKVEVPKETLQRLTAQYAISDQEDAAENLTQYIAFTIKQSNEGVDATLEVAESLANNGYEPSSTAVMQKICRHAKKHERCES